LILAAGRGSRMGTITEDKPKCLTDLAGKKILEWEILSLKEAGVDEVYAVGGYKHTMLKDYLPVKFINERWESTNSVMTLASADILLSSEACIVSYSDIIYHPDIVRLLMSSMSSLSITYDIDWYDLWGSRFSDPLSDAETLVVKNGVIEEIGNKTDNIKDIEGQYMGLLKITPDAWSNIKKYIYDLSNDEQDKLDVTALLKQLIIAGETVLGVPVKGKWCEVDQKTDLLLYEDKISTESNWKHDWRW